MSFDQRFWLRLATRSDAAQEEEEKQQLAALAKVGCSSGAGGCKGDIGSFAFELLVYVLFPSKATCLPA